MRSQYSERPARVMYQLRRDGIANVWLRNNIEEVEDPIEFEPEQDAIFGDSDDEIDPILPEPSHHWEADEVFFTTTTLGMLEIEAKFDELWEYYSSEDTPIPTRVFSVEQNSRDANDAIAELSEIISEIVGGSE